MPRNPSSREGPLRLNRFLALAGHGSRRGVESLVKAGRVAVDGRIVTDLACRVDPAASAVTVDGQPATLPRDARVYAFHKPLGVVCTLRPQGAQTGLGEYRRRGGLPERFQPVGRLDHDSAGLLLWTDDGVLARALLSPRSEVWKTYLVVLARPLDRAAARTLTNGSLVLDGRPVRPGRIAPDEAGDPCRWLLTLHEGRKRQIRRMVGAVDNRVVSLVRVAFGPVHLGRLHPGGFRRLGRDEDLALRRAAGLTDPS
ncbi:MAG TPA: pseudouridine synthase [Candidatus Krumholzibacteria bacterium]|nr:pseudouridine synthase [Candidatus Krumholzibacteria bacterium]HPD71572.1 pseudouridine synthase [Candidatus Krumholzibacteria bacterium]HRY41495.1 pseudouridine synthase [Candidatus Krumholzibacteria bacterium]